jgi:hypothetical protein
MEGKWEILKFNSDYEIYSAHPHPIRKIGTDSILNEYCYDNGYLLVYVGGQTRAKHRLVAFQFIPNDEPDTKIYVDHINRIKTDCRIENLRWVTPSENMVNRDSWAFSKQKSIYLTAIPENHFQIEEYRDYEFDKYYFDEDEEQIFTITKGNRLKVVRPHKSKNIYQISLTDLNNKPRKFNYNKLIEFLRNY